jgi:hypothetical protein
MKQMIRMCVAVGLLAGAARAETVSIVQITDLGGKSDYQVVGREEYAALLKEIAEEMKVYPAAAAEAKKDWDAAQKDKEAKERQPFQGARVKPRSVKKAGADFPDREKADKKLAQLKERASEKELEELEKAEKARKAKKADPDDEARETARVKAFEGAVTAVSKKMGDKLGRPVPAIGAVFGSADAAGAKKEAEAKKAAEAKKKEEAKK